VSINITGIDNIREQQLLGYWHGDSLTMELVLGIITKSIKEVNVIVTADKRGDYIEQIIQAYGAKALRLPDGLKMRPFFKELIEVGTDTKGILAASLDGPLGPLHEPKKLLFLLAAKSNKELVYLEFSYKRVLRLTRRWDNYVILFPFSKVNATLKTMGNITNDELSNFNDIKQKMMDQVLDFA
jgi:lysophospholipid acyltransferase (LPLAT)-like uncharacterized protein